MCLLLDKCIQREVKKDSHDTARELGKGREGEKSYLHVNNGPIHSIEIKGKVFYYFYNKFPFRIYFSLPFSLFFLL